MGLSASEGILVGRGREASNACLALSLSSGSSVVLKSESDEVMVEPLPSSTTILGEFSKALSVQRPT
jgi:hypothetical protein